LNLKKFFTAGWDSYLGDKRKLDELLEEKEECEIAIRDKHRDWKEMQECLPDVEQRIVKLQEKN